MPSNGASHAIPFALAGTLSSRRCTQRSFPKSYVKPLPLFTLSVTFFLGGQECKSKPSASDRFLPPVMARPVLLWSFSSVIPLKVHYTEFVPSAEVSTSLLLPTETPRSFPAGKLIALITGQTGTKVSIDRSICAATFLWIVRISCTPTERNNDRCPP